MERGRTEIYVKKVADTIKATCPKVSLTKCEFAHCKLMSVDFSKKENKGKGGAAKRGRVTSGTPPTPTTSTPISKRSKLKVVTPASIPASKKRNLIKVGTNSNGKGNRAIEKKTAPDFNTVGQGSGVGIQLGSSDGDGQSSFSNSQNNHNHRTTDDKSSLTTTTTSMSTSLDVRESDHMVIDDEYDAQEQTNEVRNQPHQSISEHIPKIKNSETSEDENGIFSQNEFEVASQGSLEVQPRSPLLSFLPPSLRSLLL